MFGIFLSFFIAFFKLLFSPQISSLSFICRPAAPITTSSPGSRDPSGLKLCLPDSLSGEMGRFPLNNWKGCFQGLRHPTPEPCTWRGRCIGCSLLITHSDMLHLSESVLQGDAVMTQRMCRGKRPTLCWGYRRALVLTQRLSKVLSWDFRTLFCIKERKIEGQYWMWCMPPSLI